MYPKVQFTTVVVTSSYLVYATSSRCMHPLVSRVQLASSISLSALRPGVSFDIKDIFITTQSDNAARHLAIA